MENLRFKGLLWNFERSGNPHACWPYPGRMDKNGYSRAYAGDGKFSMAHRLSYIFCVGPIPDDLVIDHLCKNKRCMNPKHLEPVTQKENVFRSEVIRFGRASHCRKGHLLSDENIRKTADSGKYCRECSNSRQRELRKEFPERFRAYERKKYERKRSGERAGPKLGEQSSNAKLTEDQAREILFSDIGVTEATKKFNISVSAVYAIRSRRLWKHLS